MLLLLLLLLMMMTIVLVRFCNVVHGTFSVDIRM